MGKILDTTIRTLEPNEPAPCCERISSWSLVCWVDFCRCQQQSLDYKPRYYRYSMNHGGSAQDHWPTTEPEQYLMTRNLLTLVLFFGQFIPVYILAIYFWNVYSILILSSIHSINLLSSENPFAFLVIRATYPTHRILQFIALTISVPV
jgi:hypothetical protein